jgi:ribosomal 50S subunit-recycling heat shock protein
VEKRYVPLWLEAQRAFKGGKVAANGQSAKPQKLVSPGDVIEITRPLGRRQRVVVKGTAERHVPRAEARPTHDSGPP